ncbi:hypothetical protein JQ604_40950 [Bradyrhizobium jicamae]|nr:hypothetical protein [Bradyrhizobium jicamae]MBR0758589.1 hypothetical protein [Bradyrhizobium jicamae]
MFPIYEWEKVAIDDRCDGVTMDADSVASISDISGMIEYRAYAIGRDGQS